MKQNEHKRKPQLDQSESKGQPHHMEHTYSVAPLRPVLF